MNGGHENSYAAFALSLSPHITPPSHNITSSLLVTRPEASPPYKNPASKAPFSSTSSLSLFPYSWGCYSCCYSLPSFSLSLSFHPPDLLPQPSDFPQLLFIIESSAFLPQQTCTPSCSPFKKIRTACAVIHFLSPDTGLVSDTHITLSLLFFPLFIPMPSTALGRVPAGMLLRASRSSLRRTLYGSFPTLKSIYAGPFVRTIHAAASSTTFYDESVAHVSFCTMPEPSGS